ncbi:MAG: tagaturonate epimerase family protein, partial [Desulforhopalus sp.]
IANSDFFTIDVADFIGKKTDDRSVAEFIRKYSHLTGELSISGMDKPLRVSEGLLQVIAERYLYAVQEAARIYRHIEKRKGAGGFIVEVSMDETAQPQTPEEMLFILAALAHEEVPVQTIAPKFTGRFNKGVDYIGDVDKFRQEFEADICIITYAVQKFGLPGNLKLSVHSGSDKFSIYQPIREIITRHDAGVHVKTAGTTWLEELIGLAEAGGSGLSAAKKIYEASYDRFEELCAPYVSVIDIDRDALPRPRDLQSWTSEQYVQALRHDQSCADYNVNLRQLLHVGYKVAAEMGEEYRQLLRTNRGVVAKNVTENLFKNHIVPLFL